ncbi:hypothetical protein L6452_13542 [Arctium lappa]|uniref:Uncharacterized protein n=1 Tax=Arctium lappa TaxID=4217 RepID=A0ACB9CIL4_ARCLA|nr:hypothetical protein L6452_13542 [Arctium lappa]
MCCQVSNQEAIDIVRPFCVGTEKPVLFSACKKLVGLSTTRGSYDDMSVMLRDEGRELDKELRQLSKENLCSENTWFIYMHGPGDGFTW